VFHIDIETSTVRDDTSSRPWRPVVHGAVADAALAAALDLGRVIATLERDPDPTLAKGTAGQAVALAYLARQWPGEGFEKTSHELLSAAGNSVASERMTIGLMQGFTGIAWAVNHLSWGGEDATEQIDDALIGLLEKPGWRGEYDLVSGLAGIGTYGLERAGTEAGLRLVELVVDRLIERSETIDGRTRWFTPPEFILAAKLGRAPKGFYNLGMAHGLPAVVAFLADACEAGIAVDKALPVLRGAVEYLLSERLDGADSTWPYFVGEEVEIMPARLAWCYGDLGVLSALRRAVAVTGDETWGAALHTGLDRVLKRSPETSGVTGVSLCHGTAGLALMFARLSFHLDSEELAAEAARWIEATLRLQDPSKPLGGFSVWDPDSRDEEGDVQGPGLLAGIAGVALALLACASRHAPSWDRALMLSGPAQ